MFPTIKLYCYKIDNKQGPAPCASGVARGVRGVRAAPGGTCCGRQTGENCKKNHGKIQIVRRHLLQLSAADSASDQSSKFKELDVDSCSALTLLKDYEVGVY